MRKALDGSRGHAGPWESAGATGGNVTNAKAATDAPSPKALARQADRAREAANGAFARGDFAAAATGYERALELDPGAATSDETRLMLAVIHVRRIPDRAKAVAMLDAVGAALPAHLRELQAALRAELPG